ncbi:MAG: phosphodiesterase, uncharacterized protein, partial [Candidatus Nomurabacteria bacterium]|nr:phosphodiesterase, uncharacterized protein [Candidatus Nomurabacteria bacterium]
MHISVILPIALLLGGVLGYVLRIIILQAQKNSLELSISERLLAAREQAQKLIDEAHAKSDEVHERLVRKEALLDSRQLELDERAGILEENKILLAEELDTAEALRQEYEEDLVTLAGITKTEARELLLEETEAQYHEDLEVRSHKLDTQMRETLGDRAKNILVMAIQRLAVPTANELTTSTVTIPNEEVKGKIIGKEGRNIRTFERFSGVELLVDESPGAIVVSCFDPVRRAIAVQALQTLVEDGRIQPARIEEELELAREKIHETIKEKGAAAVYECGIYNFDPRLVAILGRLHFRTSYGQNVLQHSIEMAHIAEMLAAEV